MSPVLKRFAVLHAALVLAVSTAGAAPPAPDLAPAASLPAAQAVDATPWLYRGSDIPVDRQWTFGELGNGLRYAIRRNGVPPGQVSIRVAIDAGALMERDAERGYAHFLEHLSFRGSRYVDDGEAKRVWQRLGATFGSDSNAETSQTQTIYRLDLPQATPDALEESLRILSGMMAAPTLSATEVDAERRTILAEARERDGAEVRLQQQTAQLLFAGQPLANRTPIGTPETLSAATPETLRAFHDRWYRPDKTVIAISGDADPDAVAAILKRHFADWRPAPGASPPPEDFGQPQPGQPTTAFLVEPALQTGITLAWLRPWQLKDDTIALNQARLVDIIASRILNRRLELLARAGGSFLEAEIQQADLARSADVTEISVTPVGQDWPTALRDIRAIIADAIANPPSRAEVDRETSEFRSLLDVQVETARAEPSAKQADNMIEAVNIRETIASAEVARDVFGSMMGKFGPEDIRAAMARLFSGIGPRVLLNSQVDDPEGADRLAAIMAEPVTVRVARPDQISVSFDDLPKFGPPGQIIARRALPFSETELLTLSNGVHVLLGPSTAEAGRIYVSARFGTGLLGLPKDRMTPVWSVGALSATGIGTVRQDAIDQLTSGRQISLGISVGEEAFFMGATTRPADLADQLRLLAAKFLSPGWDPAPILRTRAAAVLALQTASASPSDVLQRDIAALIRNGDKRWTRPSKADAEALTPEAFRAFWAPILANGPIELSVYGDVRREAALAAILASFGALPPRPMAPRTTKSPRIDAASPTAVPIQLTHKGAADQAMAILAWPTGGGMRKITIGRQLEILAAIFNDRLFEQFREGEGASYSPDASSNWPQGSDSGGNFSVIAHVRPDALNVFFQRANAIAADLARTPVTPDEIRRATEPMLQRLSRASTGNGFWLSQLSGASTAPLRITNLLRWRDDIERTTPADIAALAKRYLRPGAALSFVIVPEAPAPAPAPALAP